jgi:Protein of unknown function (DUF3305)
LARELTIIVGVLVEKRKSTSRWASDYWIPVGVMPAPSGLVPGDIVMQDEQTTRYFMGVSELTCHAAETEAYVHNFNSRTPALYVVLRQDSEGEHPLPWYVNDVTASPYLAQDYEDSAEDIVERVAMPLEISEAIIEFTNTYHVEEPFKKRRRDKLKQEDLKFGKEPIFMNRKRRPGDKLDG